MVPVGLAGLAHDSPSGRRTGAHRPVAGGAGTGSPGRSGSPPAQCRGPAGCCGRRGSPGPASATPVPRLRTPAREGQQEPGRGAGGDHRSDPPTGRGRSGRGSCSAIRRRSGGIPRATVVADLLGLQRRAAPPPITPRGAAVAGWPISGCSTSPWVASRSAAADYDIHHDECRDLPALGELSSGIGTDLDPRREARRGRRAADADRRREGGSIFGETADQ